MTVFALFAFTPLLLFSKNVRILLMNAIVDSYLYLSILMWYLYDYAIHSGFKEFLLRHFSYYFNKSIDLFNRIRFYRIRYLDPNNIVITYKINSQTYKQIINIKSKPSNILAVENSDGADITDQVLPYLGIEENIYKSNVNPKFFNTKTLTFYTQNGDTIIMNSNQIHEDTINRLLDTRDHKKKI